MSNISLIIEELNYGRSNKEHINEAASSFSDKLNDFISNVDDDKKKNIKSILNAIYLGIGHNKWTYEEDGKATKGKYKNGFSKPGGEKDLDQLTWNVRLNIPFDSSKKIKYVSDICENDIRDILKSKASMVGGTYVLDATNNDFWETVFFDNCAVAVGFPKNSGAYHYDTTTQERKVRITFKVVVPHIEKEKKKVDNDANHKVIITKVKKFSDNSSKVLKVLDEFYKAISSYGGYVDGKKVMDSIGKVNNSEYRMNNPVDVATLYWKTELDGSTHYSSKELDKVIDKYSEDGKTYNAVFGGETYYCAKVGNGLYVGYRHDYGSRSTEFFYLCVLREVSKGELPFSKAEMLNPFVSKDGMSLQNKLCTVRYDRAGQSITGADLTDMYNEPRFMTRGKKNLDKAWSELLSKFNNTTTMSEVTSIVYKYTPTHSWYGMD